MAEMKDSKDLYIGDIPKDWDVYCVKHLFKIGRGRVISELELVDGGKYPVYSSQTKNDGCMGYINSYDFDIEQLTWTTDGVYAGTVFIRHGKHNCTNVCGTLQPNIKNKNNLQYMKYALEHIAVCHRRKDINGGKIMNNEMAKIKIPIPKINVQIRIADFLDKKCAEIDSLHADIEKQIETLEEYKKSIITEAVTKGLDPDVEMKDSGVEWIGKIPIKWNTTRIGYESWIRARLGWKGLKADEYVDEGNPFLSAFNIIDNQINWKSLNYITDERYEESPEIMLKIGDIVLVKDGAGIGKCARIDDLPFKTATTNGSLAVISTKENLDYNYLYFYLQSAIFQNFIIRMMNGMGVPHLSQEELRKIVIPFPPKNEQRQIAVYLEQKRTEIDISISDKKQQLETLEQYKKSLIYEYVTGKKEVK